MTNDAARQQKAEIAKADRTLQAKAGTGSIEPDKVKKAQKNIESVTVDFVPIAKGLLEKLAAAIQDARENTGKDARILKENLTRPFMGMKADAAMFGYPLVGDLTADMLAFLEAHETLDSDMIKIVEAHYKTVQLIIARQMNGDGGATGAAFSKELENARLRYAGNRKKQS